MTGIYLKCDQCGATLGGDEVSSAPDGLHWSHSDQLQTAARARGWTGPLTRESTSDRCPACSKLAGLDIESIRKAGANARAHGVSEMANPYYRPATMPAATGESIEQWQMQVEAWRIGWTAEDLIRNGN